MLEGSEGCPSRLSGRWTFFRQSDEKPYSTRESRHSARKQFCDSDPLTDTNGHPTNT